MLLLFTDRGHDHKKIVAKVAPIDINYFNCWISHHNGKSAFREKSFLIPM